MIYELRIYECYGGRLPALNKRFSEHTCELFERHGIKNVGYWTNVIGPSNNDLIYLVAFDDMGQRERAWASFPGGPGVAAGQGDVRRGRPDCQKRQ